MNVLVHPSSSNFAAGRRATLILKNEIAFQGYSFGHEAEASGECVFQTGNVGYPESLTDPSYCGQILVLTYPLIGNYGVPATDSSNILSSQIESSKIHPSALIISDYSPQFSHYKAQQSLSDWLKASKVPALYGIDTRSLTKILRESGSTLAKIVFDGPLCEPILSRCAISISDMSWPDPNLENLVEKVSTTANFVIHPEEKDISIRILALDFGMKFNQLRCFAKRGVTVEVCPWNYDFLARNDYDGLFLSNGPGNPEVLTPVISRLKELMARKSVPIFGICLGHQLLALASGASTLKMKFGNRGQNIPCVDKTTNRCYITSQNHGYAVNADTLTADWTEYFVNANDRSNEGIYHNKLPYFSVQFHPEACPGPKDTEFLFDQFISLILAARKNGISSVMMLQKQSNPQPAISKPKKVLLLGSGGLSIGQAGEFDYSGSQAIKALKSDGIYTVLINPNIATIQTTQGLADRVYFLPLTPDYVRKVIHRERPDSIFCTFGGQTALNVGVQMKEEFESLGIQVLGTPIRSIEITEDRDMFIKALSEIGEKCAQSKSANTINEAMDAAKEIGYPVIVRAAYALGGLGSGFADNPVQMKELCAKAFASSPQVLVEKSMKGWKEIEYEVVRDAFGNCVTVCNMENFDPLGIHTGDSIVIAPSQTLSDEDYMMLRKTAINVINHLGVVGECNIQYALNPESKEYCIIEVNARLSRSSALASKATGYPLAFVAAKLGLGYSLTSIMNSVTKKTVACFEPSLDYVVVKIPRWDLKKFSRVSNRISSSMKSVGEVMCIGRTFEEAIQKAIRAVDYSFDGFSTTDLVNEIDEELVHPTDLRLFAIAAALHQGYSVDKIWSLTKIDRWFLYKLENIVHYERKLRQFSLSSLSSQVLRGAKELGFSDGQIGRIIGVSELAARKFRLEKKIRPFVKQIDTVAAEFPCFTNYLFLTYNASEDDIHFTDHGIIVLGSGVYRIGSSVEFDWCAVRCVRTLREQEKKTIMINFNPETVSTDYDEADRLYFELLNLETVLDIYEKEAAEAVVVSMGGQSANNIALPLHRQNVRILGTSPEMIDMAENRYKFSRLLDKIEVDQPEWKELSSFSDAESFCHNVGYPVLVRPSYVLSGAAMNVVYSKEDLKSYLDLATKVSSQFPVVISKFIEEAKEIEMDGVAQDGKVIVLVTSEHVENAGVHSGDATLIQPPQDLDPQTIRKIHYASEKIAKALNITGPFNIQFIAKNNEIKVIECNVRSSRSFPFVSKTLGIDMIQIATHAMLGMKLEPVSIDIPANNVAVKVPQFSFSRLAGADPILGVEMASTGEVACFGKNKYDAYLKALLATGFKLPKKNILLSIGSFKEKMELLPFVQKLCDFEFKLFATSGTADFLQEHGIKVTYLEALEEDQQVPLQKLEYSLNNHLENNLIDLYINLPSKNRFRRPANYLSRGYKSRRMAIDFAVPLITNVKCAKLFIQALCRPQIEAFEVGDVDYKCSYELISLPGFISLHPIKNDYNSAHYSKLALMSGFSVISTLDSDASQATTFCDAIKMSLFSPTMMMDRDSVAIYIDQPLKNVLEFRHLLSKDIPLIVNAQSGSVAEYLLLSQLLESHIHVSNVFSRTDMELIRLAKEQQFKITCDVDVLNLFFVRERENQDCLGSQEDVDYLWSHLDLVDCFNFGHVAQRLENPESLKSVVPLLVKAAADHKISIKDIAKKFFSVPKDIFQINVPVHTVLEIERRPIGQSIDGQLNRIIRKGIPVFLDNVHHGNSSGTLLSRESRKEIVPVPAVNTFVHQAPSSSVKRGSITGENRFFMAKVISACDFTRQDLHLLFNVAQEMKIIVEKHLPVDILKGMVMCTAFYEPSTRTCVSFEAAMNRLGGSVVSINQITSSIAKGESIADTARTLASYADLIVMRHPEPGSVGQAADVSPIPLINAGDGTGEHPTQAFLDVFTIREELGTVNGLTITLLGDLKHGRTVHSLVKLLMLYNVKLNFISPESLCMPSEILELLSQKKIQYSCSNDLSAFIPNTDVLYVTRIQKERFSSMKEYEKVFNSYLITTETLKNAKSNMIIMHPLPRINEIDPTVDYDERAAYFRQMKYGLFVRMALLALVFGKQDNFR